MIKNTKRKPGPDRPPPNHLNACRQMGVGQLLWFNVMDLPLHLPSSDLRPTFFPFTLLKCDEAREMRSAISFSATEEPALLGCRLEHFGGPGCDAVSIWTSRRPYPAEEQEVVTITHYSLTTWRPGLHRQWCSRPTMMSTSLRSAAKSRFLMRTALPSGGLLSRSPDVCRSSRNDKIPPRPEQTWWRPRKEHSWTSSQSLFFDLKNEPCSVTSNSNAVSLPPPFCDDTFPLSGEVSVRELFSAYCHWAVLKASDGKEAAFNLSSWLQRSPFFFDRRSDVVNWRVSMLEVVRCALTMNMRRCSLKNHVTWNKTADSKLLPYKDNQTLPGENRSPPRHCQRLAQHGRWTVSQQRPVQPHKRAERSTEASMLARSFSSALEGQISSWPSSTRWGTSRSPQTKRLPISLDSTTSRALSGLVSSGYVSSFFQRAGSATPDCVGHEHPCGHLAAETLDSLQTRTREHCQPFLQDLIVAPPFLCPQRRRTNKTSRANKEFARPKSNNTALDITLHLLHHMASAAGSRNLSRTLADGFSWIGYSRIVGLNRPSASNIANRATNAARIPPLDVSPRNGLRDRPEARRPTSNRFLLNRRGREQARFGETRPPSSRHTRVRRERVQSHGSSFRTRAVREASESRSQMVRTWHTQFHFLQPTTMSQLCPRAADTGPTNYANTFQENNITLNFTPVLPRHHLCGFHVETAKN